MAKYILSIKATSDLTEIWNYTFDNWSETQADNYYQMLLDAFQDISNHKIKGKKYPEIAMTVLGARIAQHIIFYKWVSPTRVVIARILHSRMDLRNRILE
jgi:toxin ParE1/3/4